MSYVGPGSQKVKGQGHGGITYAGNRAQAESTGHSTIELEFLVNCIIN